MSQSPELAGGEGFTIEGYCAAFYMTYLLSEGYAPGVENCKVSCVSVQQRDFGEPLDDVIVDFVSIDESTIRLSLQAKRSLTISSAVTNKDFREIIRDSWKTLNNKSFRQNIDRYGAITGEVAKTKSRALRTLCEYAKESLTVGHFDARFDSSGNASNEVKKVKDDIASLLNEANNQPCSSGDIYKFLKHFVLVEIDFLHEGAKAPAEAITLLKSCLHRKDIEKAPLLWSHICKLARSSAGKAGQFDRVRLVKEVSNVVKLQAASSLLPSVEKVTELTQGYINNIQDKVGGVSLERNNASRELDNALQSSRFIRISGLPGSGKSVLLKQNIQIALDEGVVLFLKGDQLSGRSWMHFSSEHGISDVSLLDLLVEIGAIGTPVLYIDGIDRIEKEQQPIILDVVSTIVRNPLLSNWKIVVSIRSAGISPLRNWLGDELKEVNVSTVTVELLNDEEAESLAIANPKLRSLLFGTDKLREIVRRPFFAKVLNQGSYSPESSESFILQSEVDLIHSWWERGGYNASGQDSTNRQLALIELAEIRVKRLSKPIKLKELKESKGLIEEFVSDGILQYEKAGATLRFSHDIFFEWALFYSLVGEGDDWLELIQEFGEPPAIGRVVELLSQHEYSSTSDWSIYLKQSDSSNVRSQWMRAWLLGPLSSPHFLGKESLFFDTVSTDKFLLLKKVLVWFQAEKTVPNPVVLTQDLPQEQKLQVADALGWPSDLPTWRRFITFLTQHISDIPLELYPLVLTTFEVWQNALTDIKNDISHKILSICGDWLYQIDRASRKEVNASEWREISDIDEFRRSIRRMLFKASLVEPELVTDYLNSIIVSDGVKEQVFKDIALFSPRLAQSHSHLLVELTLKYLKEELPHDQLEREKVGAKVAAEHRQAALEKPEEKRTREDQFAIEGLFSVIGHGSFSEQDWEHLSLSRDMNSFWPISPLREPFHSLFQYSPKKAIYLLSELCNHAIIAWRQLHKYERGHYQKPIPLIIDFPWGTQRFWGGDREYLWHRTHHAPNSIGCGLMALEEWCIKELDRGQELDGIIQEAVQCNECIAILNVVNALVLQTEYVSKVTFPLVTSQRLLDVDKTRRIQDITGSSSLLMGFKSPSDQNHIEAIKESSNRGVRSKWLADLIIKFAFFSEEFSELICNKIADFKSSLPFQYEEDRCVIKEQERLTIQAEEYEYLIDPKNYHLEKIDNSNKVVVVHDSPSALKPERVAAAEDASLRLQTGNLLAWASNSLERGNLGESYSITESIEFAKSIDNDSLFSTSVFSVYDLELNKGTVAAIAAITLQFRKEIDEKSLDWARDVLVRAIQSPKAEYESYAPDSVMPWHPAVFGVRGLSADLSYGTGSKANEVQLINLIGYPLDDVSLLAIEMICDCWEKNPKLVWSGLFFAFSRCLVFPNDQSQHINSSLDSSVKYLEEGSSWLSFPLPGPAWIEVDSVELSAIKRNQRILHERSAWKKYKESPPFDPADGWKSPDIHWDSDYAAKILPLIPVKYILRSTAKDAFLNFISKLLEWTKHKQYPDWDVNGTITRKRVVSFDWPSALGRLCGHIAGELSTEESYLVIDPILSLQGEACWSLLGPFTEAYVCQYIFDEKEVPDNSISILSICLDKLLEADEFRKDGYRAGELSGFCQPMLVKALMFVSAEYANLSSRYANGDWSEIERIIPIVDRFVRNAGWIPLVIEYFLTLCERAKEHYPADKFADQILFVIETNELSEWQETLIPARIAGLVQFLVNQSFPLSQTTAQKFLKILDWQVDIGDRRSAELQLSEVFREIYVPFVNTN